MKQLKSIILILLFMIFPKLLFSEVIKTKYYETKRYKVQITAMEDEPRLSQSLNLVEVALFDKQTLNYWYMWYIIDGDKQYLIQEYETNPELNITFSYYAGIKDIDINQFASEKILEIADVKNGLHSDYYAELEKPDGTYSHFAYSRTSKDTIKLRASITK